MYDFVEFQHLYLIFYIESKNFHYSKQQQQLAGNQYVLCVSVQSKYDSGGVNFIMYQYKILNHTHLGTVAVSFCTVNLY